MAPRILVVEDDIINQTLTTLLFRKAGIEPVVVADGLQAVQMAASQSFDIIFMDLHLPGIDGYTAARRIMLLALNRPVPVLIAMSAGLVSGHENALLDAGFKDYLAKPLTMDVLVEKLDKWRPSRLRKPVLQ